MNLRSLGKAIRIKTCAQCGAQFDAHSAVHRFCSNVCKAKFRSAREKAKGRNARHCRQCGTRFEIETVKDCNRWHCSDECSVKSARESRSRFWDRNPGKNAEYQVAYRAKLGPEANLRSLLRRYLTMPRACQSCGEVRVLDIAHRPEHKRNGAYRRWRTITPETVWILCPTCHALLDRMHYPPSDLGLV